MTENAARIEITPEREKEIQEAAEREKKIREARGHADDSTYFCVEIEQSTGEPALITMPVQIGGEMRQRLVIFDHPTRWEQWVEERGQLGFGYLIGKIVHGKVGQRTGEELVELSKKDTQEFRQAIAMESFEVTVAKGAKNVAQAKEILAEERTDQLQTQPAGILEEIWSRATEPERQAILEWAASKLDAKSTTRLTREEWADAEVDNSSRDFPASETLGEDTEKMLAEQKKYAGFARMTAKEFRAEVKSWSPVHEFVNSSNLVSCYYNATKLILCVVFKNGSVYDYSGVTVEIFEGFKKAESAGKYLAANIAKSYAFARVK